MTNEDLYRTARFTRSTRIEDAESGHPLTGYQPSYDFIATLALLLPVMLLAAWCQ